MSVVLYGLSVASLALAAIAATQLASHRFARRWGLVPGPALHVGRGAYRQASVRPGVLRGTPPGIAWTASVGVVWAILTTLVFAPMMLCVGAASDGVGVLGIVTGVGLVVTGSSGFFLGLALACVSFFVVRRDRDVVDLAEGAVVWSVLHHLAGLLFAVLHSIAVPGPSLLVLTAPVWIFGLAHAYALQEAAHSSTEGPQPADELV